MFIFGKLLGVMINSDIFYTISNIKSTNMNELLKFIIQILIANFNAQPKHLPTHLGYQKVSPPTLQTSLSQKKGSRALPKC